MGNRRNYLILVLIVFSVFAFDLTTKLLQVNHFKGFTRYSAIPKLVLELGLIYYLFKNRSGNKTNYYFGFALLAIAIANFFIANVKINSQSIFQHIYVLNKFLYVFLFATVVLNLELDKRKELIINLRNILVFWGFVNGLFILFGYLSGFDFLRSYRYTDRFGYNGLFVKTSEVSYYYILLIITTYYEYIYKKRNAILLIFFIGVSLLIGTKVVWLFLFLLGLLHFLFHKKKILKYGARILTLIVALLSYIYYEYIVNFIVNSFSFGPKLYEEHGFLTVITSGRDLLFMDAIAYISKKWSVANYMIGGIDLEAYGVEFEFVDIFLVFGSIGLILYILFLKRIFFNAFNNKHKTLLFIALMLAVSFAGNFFMCVICSIFAFTVFQNMAYMHEKT